MFAKWFSQFKSKPTPLTLTNDAALSEVFNEDTVKEGYTRLGISSRDYINFHEIDPRIKYNDVWNEPFIMTTTIYVPTEHLNEILEKLKSRSIGYHIMDQELQVYKPSIP